MKDRVQSRRVLIGGRSLSPVAVTVIVATTALLVPVLAAPQGRASAGNDWTTPMTPWGDPNLQGVWTTTVSSRSSARISMRLESGGWSCALNETCRHSGRERSKY